MLRYIISALILSTVMIAYGQEKDMNPPEGMVLIPGGSFMMGTNDGQGIAAPKHPVCRMGREEASYGSRMGICCQGRTGRHYRRITQRDLPVEPSGFSVEGDGIPDPAASLSIIEMRYHHTGLIWQVDSGALRISTSPRTIVRDLLLNRHNQGCSLIESDNTET